MLKATSLFVSAALALALPAFAADPKDTNASGKPVIDQLREESRMVKKNATELVTMLKNKKADLSKAAEQVAAVEKSHETIRNLIAQLEAEAGNWDPARKASFEQAKSVTGLMSIFVENEKKIAEGGIGPQKRDELRMAAAGVAKRAELLEKTLSKL